MKLFLIYQNQKSGYDKYDSAVVAAIDEETARNMDPSTGDPIEDWKRDFSTWCDGPEHVGVQYLGEAVNVEPGIVCASFNPG